MNPDTTAAITEVSKAFGLFESDEQSNAVFSALLDRLKEAATAHGPTSFDTVLDILTQIERELQLGLPDPIVLVDLNKELNRLMAARFAQAARDISEKGRTDVYGDEAEKQAEELQLRAKRIGLVAAQKVTQINALTAFVLATKQSAGGAPPAVPPVDNTSRGGDDGEMLKRIEKLETDVAAIKIDVAVIKANGSTKADLAQLDSSLKVGIAEAKTAIVLWVVGAIFLAQLLPAVLKIFVK